MIPNIVLERVRTRVQGPRTRPSRKCDVFLLPDNSRPNWATHPMNGRTVVTVGKEYLCGDYYD